MNKPLTLGSLFSGSGTGKQAAKGKRFIHQAFPPLSPVQNMLSAFRHG